VISSNIQQARSKLSQLIERAVAGEEVVIRKAGKPIVSLVPYRAKRKPRRLGIWRGKVRIAADFDELPESLQAAFGSEHE
jgi:prevent-host-death family protein